MKTSLFLAATAGLALAACSAEPASDKSDDTAGDMPGATGEEIDAIATAQAELKDADGKNVGTANLTQQVGGEIALTLNVTDMTPGKHGVHIHQTGSCTAPDFKDAGGHWNPEDKMHGLDNPKGQHAGDLPNLEVGEDGTGRLTYKIDGLTIEGGDNALLDADGAAFVIHSGPDDQKTDPSGDSGERVACGVFAAG